MAFADSADVLLFLTYIIPKDVKWRKTFHANGAMFGELF